MTESGESSGLADITESVMDLICETTEAIVPETTVTSFHSYRFTDNNTDIDLILQIAGSDIGQ